MEVFVVILLLLGAISLGSAPHEAMDGDSTTVEAPAAANALPVGTDDVRTSEDDEEEQLQDCMLNRHDVIYRDLSRAYGRQVVAATESAGDCDGLCADE